MRKRTGVRTVSSSTDKTDYRFPLAIYKPISAEDVDVRLRFKPISGVVDQAGGVAVRLLTPDNYYVVRANALENNVRFYRVIDGKREQLASASVTVSHKEWHELVPTRTSYVMAVVTPPERPAAASVTAVPRSLASAVSPAIAGALLSTTAAGLPLVICGCLKIAYDLALLYSFRHVKPPEER